MYDCIGAIDGTHIPAFVRVEDQIRFIGRKGAPTQNILAVCDFDMCFTYVMPEWERITHDKWVLQHCLRDDSSNFFRPIGGTFIKIKGY